MTDRGVWMRNQYSQWVMSTRLQNTDFNTLAIVNEECFHLYCHCPLFIQTLTQIFILWLETVSRLTCIAVPAGIKSGHWTRPIFVMAVHRYSRWQWIWGINQGDKEIVAISVLALYKLKQNQSHSKKNSEFLAILLSLKDVQFYNLYQILLWHCCI